MILVQVALTPPRRAMDSSSRLPMEIIYVRLLGGGDAPSIRDGCLHAG